MKNNALMVICALLLTACTGTCIDICLPNGSGRCPPCPSIESQRLDRKIYQHNRAAMKQIEKKAKKQQQIEKEMQKQKQIEAAIKKQKQMEQEAGLAQQQSRRISDK